MQGTWTEEDVAGHACRYYQPPSRHEHGFVVLYLHDAKAERLESHPAFCAEFDKHGLPVVAPVTRRSWWADRICEEFDPRLTAEQHVLKNVLPAIEERYGAAPPQIGLLGVGMGGQGALRIAYKHPRQFPAVAAISPAVDYWRLVDRGDETLPLMYEDPEAARQESATLLVHPLVFPRQQFFCCDPGDFDWVESRERLHMKLHSLGIPHEFHTETRGGRHTFDYFDQMAEKAVGFLVEGLERERLRVD